MLKTRKSVLKIFIVIHIDPRLILPSMANKQDINHLCSNGVMNNIVVHYDPPDARYRMALLRSAEIGVAQQIAQAFIDMDPKAGGGGIIVFLEICSLAKNKFPCCVGEAELSQAASPLSMASASANTLSKS